MNATAALANLTWLAASTPAHARFARALGNPATAQENWVRRHLRQNADTAFGRAHGLGEIRNYSDFVRRVPLATYDDLAPWITRICAGETRVLTAEPTTRLVPTSGSTGARKLIPFTAGLQRDFNAALAPWWSDLCRQHRGLPFGRAYWSISPPAQSAHAEASAVSIGFDDDSEYLGGARARLVNATMAVPSAVRHVREIEAFRYVTLLSLLRCADLRFVSVWHPSFFALLLDALPAHWEALLADVRDGTCHVDRRFVAAPARRRAEALRAIGCENPAALWPALRVISCWADANAHGPARELASRFPGVEVQPKGLLATEAFVTLPFRGVHPLAVTSHFFEFIDDAGHVHPVENLRLGQSYEVVVTTSGGLWRYRLGDRVEVTEFVGRTPSLRFIGRLGNLSDLCGEKLAEPFVARAIAAACSPGAPPAFALLAPEEDATGRPRYVLFLEGFFSAEIVHRLEAGLRRNPHYAVCRDLGQLAPVEVRSVAHGYATYAAAERERGLKLGDIKPAALSRRMDWGRHFAPLQRTAAVEPGAASHV